MKRLTPRRGTLVALALLAASCRQGSEVPTFRVEPVRFNRRVTAEGNLKSTKATPLSAPHDAPGQLKIAWIVPDGELLKKDEVVVRFDPTDFETQLTAGREDHDTAGNKMIKTNSESSTTRTNLRRDARQAGDELLAARTFKFDDAEIFSRYQRVESQIDETLAGRKKEHAEGVLGVRAKLSAADRDLVSIEQRKADLKIRNAEQGLHALEMRAPYDGILVLQRDWRGDVVRVGDTVWPGSPIGEIPDLNSMKAEVFVLEADAAGLAVGEKATLSVEGKPGSVITGKITQVDKLARPRFPRVPVQYFGATITLDKTDPSMMKPGARVRAVLDVEDRQSAFSIPRQAIFEKQGKKLVYCKRGGKFVPVVIEIGSSSAGRVVVTKGLVKGDEIALRDPTEEKDA
ncbi:MAG TPA: HlyD family efflux transporter periplasmic adaptor subunit [Thermoanaerobaculia bacterium]|nr:HlyD family efflux transporter periplasmic adaptor subunit [Thermoanaerobaculia bacterium]